MIRRRIIDDGCIFAVALSLATPAMAAQPAPGPATPAVSHDEAPAPETPEEAAAPTDEAAAPTDGAAAPTDEAVAPTVETAAPTDEVSEEVVLPRPSEPEVEAQEEPPAAAPTPAPRIEHPSQRTEGLALIALGAIGVFVGWHFIPPGLVWRRSARNKLEERQQMGAPAAQIEESEGRVRLATTLVVGGAVLTAACIPMFIIGIVRQEKGGNKTKVYADRRARRLQPSVGVGRNEATMGLRMRF